MSIPKILIGSPVYQNEPVLKEYLNSLKNLDKEGLIVDFYFIDDNKEVGSSNLLRNFILPNSKTYIGKRNNNKEYKYIRNDETHYWNDELAWKVAEMKNEILRFVRENKYDYVFLIDSDIMLHPYTLKNLLLQKKDIISEIFWTKWNQNNLELPQVWLYDNYSIYEILPRTESDEEITKRVVEFLKQLKIPGVYKVGGLGACTLISSKVLDQNVSFKRINNVSYWGEDRHFCIRACVQGFSLYVDTHYPALHLYRQEDMNKVELFKKSCEYKK